MERLKKIAEIAVLFPVIHIAVCVIFLAGYVAMFGGNISAAFAVSDAFTITISHIFKIYVVAATIPLLMAWLLYLRDQRHAAITEGLFEQPIDQPNKQQIRRSILEITKPWRLTIAGTIFAIYAIGYQRYYLHREISFLLSVQSIQATLPNLFHQSLKSLGVRIYARNLIWILCNLIIAAFFSGIDAGDRDRHTQYDTLLKDHLTCNNYAVLRSAANRFVVVGKGNGRYIVDEKCEIVFTFPHSWSFEPASSDTKKEKSDPNLYI